MFVVGYTVGLLQLVYCFVEVATGIDAYGNGDGTALDKRYFEVVPIDDLKKVLEGIFEDEREIVRAYGEQYLFFAPDIDRYADRVAYRFGDERSRQVGVSKGAYMQRDALVFERSNCFGMDDLRSAVCEFDGIVVGEFGQEDGLFD